MFAHQNHPVNENLTSSLLALDAAAALLPCQIVRPHYTATVDAPCKTGHHEGDARDCGAFCECLCHTNGR